MNLPIEFAKLLFIRFTNFYGERFTRNHPTTQAIEMWWQDWAMGLAGIDGDCIKSALDHCRLNVEWPPTLAEFRRYCEKASGMPDRDEAFRLALRRDFIHPIVKIAYDKIGNWSFNHDTEVVLQKRFKEAYENALHDMRKINTDNALTDEKSQINSENIFRLKGMLKDSFSIEQFGKETGVRLIKSKV